MTTYEVGQSVWLYSGQPRDTGRKVEITAVGRTLVTVEVYGREQTFRMSDGCDSKHRDTTPGPPSFIRTEEQVHEKNRRDDVRERLDGLGIRSAGYGDYRYSTEALEQVADMLTTLTPTPAALSR